MLITCGLGVPLPEDVPLITGGWLVGRNGSLPLMIVTGLAGILIGDTLIFRAGQIYGEKLLDTRLGRHIPGERVQRTIAAFDRHGPKFIMAARFVPGLRAVTYFVAGRRAFRTGSSSPTTGSPPACPRRPGCTSASGRASTGC